MAKPKSQFVCQSCGGVHSRWAGQCAYCHEWNSLVEESIESNIPGGLKGAKNAVGAGNRIGLVRLKGDIKDVKRWRSGDAEFDRVTGGGLVKGSAVLIGGDPGIGKSTLLLQTSAALANHAETPLRVAYVSGEESVDQVRMRARRLGVDDSDVQLASATSVRDILATFDHANQDAQAVDVVIIDSIQTLYLDSLESAPGSVAQVRGSAQELIRLAKKRGFALLIVGHVTKEGTIAGPKVLEHMVDAVLHFEGDRGHHFRILRSVKNRFGPADEIGVYEMQGIGLSGVANPSALFLADRNERASGSVVFAGLEGSRPVLVEIQALVSPSPLGTPRRTVVGWDATRLSMILAVLEARCGIVLANKDVFLNVAGGLRISEPAADAAVAAALISSIQDVVLNFRAVIFGEIGLSGEIRAVSQADTRMREASKLGFEQAIIPPRKPIKAPKTSAKITLDNHGLSIRELTHVADLVGWIGTKTKSGV